MLLTFMEKKIMKNFDSFKKQSLSLTDFCILQKALYTLKKQTEFGLDTIKTNTKIKQLSFPKFSFLSLIKYIRKPQNKTTPCFYTSVLLYHHVLISWILLTLSHHPSLLVIAHRRSSRPHPALS